MMTKEKCPACLKNEATGVMAISKTIQIPLLCVPCNEKLSQEEVTELFNRALANQIKRPAYN
ncbi:hypothetical protein [Niallia taxi]|uniref:hypothetical protein n=1 Tax=Niallia taxi TaxID=2499688 RepID=UPI0015F4586B|nr:hypothetical protein [Niallia taxi]